VSGSADAAAPIPLLVDTERKLGQGQYGPAVLAAYHRVVLDLQKAYGLRLPAQWTHREFLSTYLRPDMGILTDRVARLYRIYEPIRYGREADWVRGDLLELLRQIYSEPPLKDLYSKAPAAPAIDPPPRLSGIPTRSPNGGTDPRGR
jgi:hypothetical protein